MSTVANELLAELRQDHRNMAILLGLLNEQTDLIGSDQTPDFELLHDIMRYMTVYSDAMHHPKEDLIYAGMVAAQPELREGMERVEEDHEEIAELGQQLRNDIESIIAGTAITRDKVLEDAKNYMHRLQKHMAWEEEDLFRRADAQGDDLIVDTSHLTATDPVFGSMRESTFAGLLQAIAREAS